MNGQLIKIGVEVVEVRESESVLDACLRSGVDIPFSCKGGVCHACLLVCTDGDVPQGGQRGLPSPLLEQNYLLACQCRPVGPMSLVLPDPESRMTKCILHDSHAENGYLFLRFESSRELECKAGHVFKLSGVGGGAFEVTVTEFDNFLIEAICRDGDEIPSGLRHGEFGYAFTVTGPRRNVSIADGAERTQPECDPQLWSELGDGEKVRSILENFYRDVYADARLSPYFASTTIDRVIEKQYSFMRQLMTGERCYFGDRPRNAHHWMVVSDELYDYRQSIMHRTLFAHGLTECQMARWARLENHYRDDIVKHQPRPRCVGGVDLPLDGYATETLSEGSCCDYCGQSVDVGTTVHYHLRLGKISCPACVAR